MSKEVRISLTAAQKAKIKAGTGKSMEEIRVSSLGRNLAVAICGLKDQQPIDFQHFGNSIVMRDRGLE